MLSPCGFNGLKMMRVWREGLGFDQSYEKPSGNHRLSIIATRPSVGNPDCKMGRRIMAIAFVPGRHAHKAVLAFALLLGSCGGSDGGNGSVPPATSGGQTGTPTPTPSPSPAVAFGTLGQQSPYQYTLLGFAFRQANGPFGGPPVTGTLDLSYLPEFRLEAQGLAITLPGYGSGLLVQNGGRASIRRAIS